MNIKNLNLDGLGLEDLLKKVLSELYDDIAETDENIKLYKDEILKVAGKQMYGEFLNNAMRLKGDARDRIIKLVNIIKDRVKSKETIDKLNEAGGGNPAGDYRAIAKEIKEELKNEKDN